MTPAERRSLARDLTRLAGATVREALALHSQAAPRCPLIGVTGPPGVGKSSLIGKLAADRVRRCSSLAILAVDPSSPLSGGAILGDRVRMAELADDPRIFIRSLASRASHDGLADNVALMIERVARAGFGEVLVETAGVGQVEYAVRSLSDTLLLVLAPGSGDQIQAMKSGILEIPDVVVINKSDLPGADRFAAEVKVVLDRRSSAPDEWRSPIARVVAESGLGIAGLGQAIDAHHDWLQSRPRPELELRRRREILKSLVSRELGIALSALTPAALRGPPAAAFDAVLRTMQDNARR